MRSQGGVGAERSMLLQAARAVAGTSAIAKSRMASAVTSAITWAITWAPRRTVALIVAALLTASFPGAALAQIPATISKSFSPSTIEVGGLSIMTVTVTNPNATPLTNVAFSDTMPAGLTLVTQTGGTCSTGATGGGVFTINPGTGTFSSTSNVLAAGQSCNITVRVRGPTAGLFVNTTSTVTSTEAGPGGPASASIQVNALAAPTIAKTFGASSIALGGTTSLSFTITNSNSSTSLTGVGFTDALPAGLVVATPNGLSGSCGGGTITATAGGSNASLTGATIAANGSCTFSINVAGTSGGTKVNTTSAVTSNEAGNGNAASAIIMVNAVTTTTTLTSSPNPSNVGQPVTLTATVATSGGSGTPTGTVTFKDGATTLGTVPLSGTAAVFTTSALSAGSHSITATYNGDTNFSASTSSALTQTVNGASAIATTTALASSLNPSSTGQAVTFTATVAGGGGTPTGTVSFLDGGTVIGTAALTAGVAAFTTSSLTLGTHTITASYGGSTGFVASTSAALTQTVQIPADSVRLRALQVAVTKVEAQASGDAFAGAVAGAIADGFAEGGGALMTPSGNGVRFNFAAEPDAAGPGGGHVAEQYDPVLAARDGALRDGALVQSGLSQAGLPASVRSFTGEPSTAATRVDDAFAGLAYAKPMATKAPPLLAAPKVWQLWADVRGTGWNTDPSAGDIRGGQINAIAGLTRKLTPDLLVGVLGGYENFDYTSQTLNGRLKGDGWTVGGYLGWRLWPGVRFDAAVGRSGVSYNGVSGTAASSFPGNRWIGSAGLTGMYRTQWLEIEPSAKVYAVWERDSAYIDSLGTLQAENTFSTGRASSGVKVAYPMYWDAVATVAPYVGLYADYYFSSENAALLLPTTFVQGWAARTTAGISYNVAGGAKVLVGGEVGGLGSQNFTTWSVRGRASVPF
jgi:uncharacterized repeat protein (TIGR01451 family)